MDREHYHAQMSTGMVCKRNDLLVCCAHKMPARIPAAEFQALSHGTQILLLNPTACKNLARMTSMNSHLVLSLPHPNFHGGVEYTLGCWTQHVLCNHPGGSACPCPRTKHSHLNSRAHSAQLMCVGLMLLLLLLRPIKSLA